MAYGELDWMVPSWDLKVKPHKLEKLVKHKVRVEHSGLPLYDLTQQMTFV